MLLKRIHALRPGWAAAAVVVTVASMAQAVTYTPYVIRTDSSGNAPLILPNNAYVPGALEFVTFAGGQKAGLGSDDLNGMTIAELAVTITRYDDISRFAGLAGPSSAPYFNVWVTDGLGHYAVVANEPSNAAFQPLFVDNGDGSKTYDLDSGNLADKTAKIYETLGWDTGLSWLHSLLGPLPLTFGNLALVPGLTIAPPPASYIADPLNSVGSGAPDELGTSKAYGFSWVFGDTLSNYVSGDEGFVVATSTAVPVPEPMTMLAVGSAIVGLGGYVRRRRGV